MKSTTSQPETNRGGVIEEIDIRFLFIGAALAAIGVFTIQTSFDRLKKSLLLGKAHHAKTSAIQSGLVILKGIARWREPLYTPLSNAPCVYYTYTIEESKIFGLSERFVEILKEDSAERSFYFEDDSGCVVIDPAGAELESFEVYSYVTPKGGPFPASIISFMKEKNLDARKKYRFSERYIRHEYQTIIVGDMKRTRPILKSNDDIKQPREVVLNGNGGPFYCISSMTIEELMDKYKSSYVKEIVLGPALILAGVLTFGFQFFR